MTSVLIKSTNMSGSKAQKLTMASLFADMVFFCLWKVTDLWRYVFYPIVSWADDMVMSGLDLMTGYVSSIIGWVVNGAAGGNEDVALKSIVRFSSRVAVVLIPQRSELRTLSNPIWMTEEEIQKCRKVKCSMFISCAVISRILCERFAFDDANLTFSDAAGSRGRILRNALNR